MGPGSRCWRSEPQTPFLPIVCVEFGGFVHTGRARHRDLTHLPRTRFRRLCRKSVSGAVSIPARRMSSAFWSMWLALAQVTTAADALTLLEAQPAEVRLVFETLSDALAAHDNQDHIHRLAPERRTPVLKLLEHLKPGTE